VLCWSARHVFSTMTRALTLRGGDLHVVVSDQGIGLPKDFDIDQPRTSLGFKVIKSLLGQLDGRITVSSNEPKGAVIQIDLPLDNPRHDERSRTVPVPCPWGQPHGTESAIQHGKGYDTARVIERHGSHFSNLDIIEVYAAPFAQASGGTFEDDAERSSLPGAVERLKPQNEAKNRGNHGQRQRSNDDVIGAGFHSGDQ
jgi:hypothetical protein